MTESQIKTASKMLSLVLRHEPQKLNLNMDTKGWVNVEELLLNFSKKNFTMSFEDLAQIVAENNKKRFAFNDDKTKIRASQGHSLDFLEMDYLPIEPPEILYHGTSVDVVDIIKKEGIKKQSRQYVHLSQETETAKNVGGRHGKPFIFTILAKKMHENGYIFYKSENGVWLTDFVPVEFLS
jgi:putative RNA 2'-phosphotransferase